MSKKKQSNPDEQEVLEQIGDEREQGHQTEMLECAQPEIEPNVPIVVEAETREEVHKMVHELKTKAASMGLCKIESTPIVFIKQDYLDVGHFTVKLIFNK